MDVTEDNFPFYKTALEMGAPDTTYLKQAFNAAAVGDDNDKYSFALRMQGAALTVPFSTIKESERLKVLRQVDKTLQSCFNVFQDVAKGTSRSAEQAAYMVRYCQRELGF